MPAQTVIKLRRDSAADWTTADPILASGELGIESYTNKIKMGDGVTEWTGLKYGPVSDELAIRVKNASGSVAIPAGRLVQFAGAAGDTVTVQPAVTNGTIDFHTLVGVTAREIPADGFGDVIITGNVFGLNTNSYTAGTLLYADSTNAGQLTSTPPTAPSFKEPVAAVVRQGAGTSGIILVRLLIGSSLNDIHDVALSSPTTNQVLQYDGTKWVNATVDALPSQSGQNGKYLTTDGSTASWGTITIPPGTTVSDTAPSSPATGQLWWESDTGILYIYYDNFWVEAVAGIVGPQGDPGVIQSTSAPSDTTVLWIDTDDAGDMVVPAGGTTGQALVKASATDYDTTWAGPYALSPNYVINGGFDIWQRGTSFTPTAAAWTYTADRWDSGRQSGTSGATISRQASGLTGFEWALRYQRDSANTSTDALYLVQRLDSTTSRPLAGQTVTASFYARAGANYSAASSALNLFAYSGTGTDQGGFPSTWTGTSTLVNNQAFTLTTSWQRFQVSFAVGTSATQLGFLWQFNPVGTAGANDWYEIDGVQVELGSVATPFRRAATTLQGELAACQRYYFRNTTAQTYGFFAGSGLAISTTVARFSVPFPVQMRTRPSSIEVGGALGAYDGNNYQTTGTWTLTGDTGTPLSQGVDYTHGSGVFTQYRPALIGANNNINTYIGFSAEL
jgi:hypothetical protein